MHRRRTISTKLAALAGVIGMLGVGAAILAPESGATTVNYTGSTTGTQSTTTIHKGDQYQRVLNPVGTVTATLDDTNHKILNSQLTMQPSYTPTFAGPFGLQVYVRTDLEQVGAVTGTAVPSATPGITTLTANATTLLRVTVFSTKDGTQHPATDARLTDPAKCHVNLTLALTGTANRRTGSLALAQDPFTIPAFPTGTPDPNTTCGLAAGSLNTQVAGTKNSIDLHFAGAPTSAHYTGVSTGTSSTIVIKKGDALFERTVHPTGSLVADIDFTTSKVSNVQASFRPIDMAALPGVLSVLPANAHIELGIVGTPTSTLTASGSPGIDNVSVSATARMAVRVSLFSNPGVALTDPKRCYVDLKLNLTGTVDRGTDKLSLGQPRFTIPAFPIFGCGLALGPGLTLMVSGPNNSAALNYVDGVVTP